MNITETTTNVSPSSAAPVQRPAMSNTEGSNIEAKASAAEQFQAVEQSKPSVEELQASVAKIASFLDTSAHALTIRIDEQIDRPIVTVIDEETSRVVRQIPSEDVIAVAHYIESNLKQEQADQAVGLLLNVNT